MIKEDPQTALKNKRITYESNVWLSFSLARCNDVVGYDFIEEFGIG
jgi:hypothetical protein